MRTDGMPKMSLEQQVHYWHCYWRGDVSWQRV